MDEADIQRENRFLLNQLLERAILRIKEGRPLPIDLLALNTSKSNKCPYIFSGDPTTLGVAIKDIEEFFSLEEDELNKSYWIGLKTYLSEKNKRSNVIVSQDIQDLFSSSNIKSIEKVQFLEKFVTDKLTSSHVNMDYWEAVKQELILASNRTHLLDFHTKLLERRRNIESIVDLEEITKLTRKEEPSHSQIVMKSFENDGFDNDPQAIKMFRDDSVRKFSGHREFPYNNPEENKDEKSSLPGRGPSLLIKPRFYNRAIKIYDWNKYNQAHYTYNNPPPMITTSYRFHIFYPRLIGQKHIIPKYILKSMTEGGKKEEIQQQQNQNQINKDDKDKTNEQEAISPLSDRENSWQLLTFTTDGRIYHDVTFKIEKYPWDCNYKNGFVYKFENNGMLRLHFSLKRQRRIRYPR